MSAAERPRAEREQRNSTTPFFRLPPELRLRVYEDLIAGVRCVEVPTHLHPHTTLSPTYLRTCRLLRGEIEPLYYSTPNLKISFTPRVNGRVSLRGGVSTINRWLERILPMRDISSEKLSVSLGFYEFSQFDMPGNPFRPTVSVTFTPAQELAKHDVVTPHGDGCFDSFEAVRSLLEDLNVRSETDGKSLEENDVRRLFTILLNGQIIKEGELPRY